MPTITLSATGAQRVRAAVPMALFRLYELALDEDIDETHRRDAITRLLARGFACPTSSAEDPSFVPTPMSDEVRATLEATLRSLG